MTTNNQISIEVDELIAKVAKKHNLLLSKDDPILITITLNEYVVSKHLELVDQHFNSLKSDLEQLYFRQQEENKELAKKIINASLKVTQDTIASSAKKASSDLVLEVEKLQAKFVSENQKIASNNSNTKLIVIGCSVISFLCAATAVAAILLK